MDQVGPTSPSAAEPAVDFMTFNVRVDTPVDEPTGNSWASRIESVIEAVTTQDPDVIGFQEVLSKQLADLIRGLPGYCYVGEPRQEGSAGEHVPLFVRKPRFEIFECGDFWLSPTPAEKGSSGWDADVPRHCTWAKVEDQTCGQRFAVFNTHLDWKGSTARLEAARLISQRVMVARDLPAVVMGDLNAAEDSEPVRVFSETGLADTFRSIHPTERDVQTVHHYSELFGDRKIDYILCDGRWQVLDASIVRDKFAGRLPSDHYPVTAQLAYDVRVEPSGG